MIPGYVEKYGEYADKKTIRIPSLTYKVDFEKGRVNGNIDALEAVCQSIYMILNTQRYAYAIYSWDYGSEISDLFGKSIELVLCRIESIIKEALLQDDRITGISDFSAEKQGNILYITFTAKTIFGDVPIEREEAI